jgi:putative oxidoreductase
VRTIENIHPGWGVAAVRVTMGFVLAFSGYQKLAGGIGAVAGFFGQAGIPLPDVMAPFITALELVGGILLLLGLLTRWLGLLYVGEFVVAALVVIPARGLATGRLELMMLAGAVMLVLAGAGKASLDEMLARRRAEPVHAP